MSYTNLAVWNAQIALLAAAAALLVAVFRLRPAPARLFYWQALLVLCLALPALQPWRHDTVVAVAPAEVHQAVSPGPELPSPPPVSAPRHLSWPEAVLWMLGAGALARFGRFGLGLVRLARYRRAGRPLDPVPPAVERVRRRLGVYPEMAISSEIAGPVTFGLMDPVILLPANFLELDPEVQSAVACHELLHVRRRDWLSTAIEEIVRAVFWFHPAVWWMLGQIQLAREQSVDRAVVRLIVAREQYVDALLALSGARHQLDLAAAPLFLRRRHLTARVAAILKEADMSYRRLFCSMAACTGALLLAGWLVCGSLPLRGAPQTAADAAGVTVAGAERVVHRAPVEYPAEARAKGIEGTVVLDVQVAQDGKVADATVIGGPLELRRAALTSVLGWHFSPEAAGRQQVSVEFKLGAAAPAAIPGRGVVGGVPGGVVGGVVGGVPPVSGGVVGGIPGGVSSPRAAAIRRDLATPRVLKKVEIQGVSEAAAADLRKRLPFEEGKTVDADALLRAQQIAREFDEHLIVDGVMVVTRPPAGQPRPTPSMIVRVFPADEAVAALLASNPSPTPEAEFPAPPAGTMRVRVGGNVQQNKLTHSVVPEYPAEAKAARIQGMVSVGVVIDTEGKVKDTMVLKGDSLLAASALEAVKQYQYTPTLVNGKPAEVSSVVAVSYVIR